MKHNVYFEEHGGTLVDDKYDVPYNSIVPSPGTSTRTGYTLDGWFTAASGGTEWDFGTGTMPDSNLTLHAQWTPVDYEIEYIMNGGTNHVDNPDTYTIEDAVTLKDPTKTGYTFAGWTPTDNIPLRIDRPKRRSRQRGKRTLR